MKNQKLAGLVILVLGVLATVGNVRAEEQQRSVARVSLIQGDVSTLRGDSGDWVPTTVNAPLVPGDNVSTGEGSRVEVQLDYADILRLDQRTQAKIADLTRARIQVQVSRGLISFTVLKGAEADIEIDTPNVAVHPLGEGTYRVQVDSETRTEVIVRRGEAEVSTPQGSATVRKNEIMTVEGAEETQNQSYLVARAPGRDEWDEWNQDRDRTITGASSWQYANRYYTGTEDLDRYGQWVNVPGYDYVWTPYANAGWVPYRHGRWCWEPFWGWTWVSYEPWGWAPYHYGRWFYYNNNWCWWPGPVYPAYRPVWAPAYVSFFGLGFGGRHFALGLGFSSIGWLPLGPCDPFFPWFGFKRGFNRINVTNFANITNIRNINTPVVAPLANPGNQPAISNVQAVFNSIHVRRAITTVPAEDFVKGRMPGSIQTVNAAMLREADLVAGKLPVVPTRDSFRPLDGSVNPASLPAQPASAEHFFTRRASPTGGQVFADRAAELPQIMQRHNRVREGGKGGELGSAGSNPGPEPAPPVASGLDAGNIAAQPPVERMTPTNGQPNNRGVAPPWQGSGSGNSQVVPGGQPGAVSPQTTHWRRVDSGNWRQPNFVVASPPAAAGITQGQPGTGLSRSQLPKPEGNLGVPAVTVEQQSPGWEQFGPARPQPPSPAPGWRYAGPANAPVDHPRFQTPPEPAGPAFEDRRGWHRFTPQAPPPLAEPLPGNSAAFPVQSGRGPMIGSADRAAGPPREQMGFPSHSEGPVYRPPSPTYERPPLEIGRPIVTERAPRGYEGGGNQGGYGGGNWGRVQGAQGGAVSAAPPSPRQSESRARQQQ